MGAEADPKYEAAWKQDRRTRFGAVAIGTLPLVSAAVAREIWETGYWHWVAFAAVAVLAIPVAGKLPKLSCPRCGETFAGPGLFGSMRSCHRCGLPYGAERAPNAEKGGG